MLPAPCLVQIQVKDQSGEFVPNANVSVTAAGIADRGWTDAKGLHTLSLSAAGQYTLRVEGSGFEPFFKDLSMTTCTDSVVPRVEAILKVMKPGMLVLTAENHQIPLESASVPTQLVQPPKPRFLQRLKHLFIRAGNG